MGLAVELDAEDGDQEESDLPGADTVLSGLTLEEFVAFDNETSTSETLTDSWEKELFRAARGEDPAEKTEGEEEEDGAQVKKVLGDVALKYPSSLKDYALQQHGMEDVLGLILRADDIVSGAKVSRKMERKQSTMDSWLIRG